MYTVLEEIVTIIVFKETKLEVCVSSYIMKLVDLLGLRTQQDPDHFRMDLKMHRFNVFSK